MASPGELVKCVAQVLGIPEPTVVVHDRNLAEAGLRLKGGRGRSAAKMTPADAANLLIAIAGSSMVKDTVQTVGDYSGLPAKGGETSVRTGPHSRGIDGNPSGTWQLEGLPIPTLQALPADHTFRDALVALLTASADGSLRAAREALPAKVVGDFQFPQSWKIDVTFRGPLPQASIRIWTEEANERHDYSDCPDDLDKIIQWSEAYPGNLTQLRQFDQVTIIAVGQAISIQKSIK